VATDLPPVAPDGVPDVAGAVLDGMAVATVAPAGAGADEGVAAVEVPAPAGDNLPSPVRSMAVDATTIEQLSPIADVAAMPVAPAKAVKPAITLAPVGQDVTPVRGRVAMADETKEAEAVDETATEDEPAADAAMLPPIPAEPQMVATLPAAPLPSVPEQAAAAWRAVSQAETRPAVTSPEPRVAAAIAAAPLRVAPVAPALPTADAAKIADMLAASDPVAATPAGTAGAASIPMTSTIAMAQAASQPPVAAVAPVVVADADRGMPAAPATQAALQAMLAAGGRQGMVVTPVATPVPATVPSQAASAAPVVVPTPAPATEATSTAVAATAPAPAAMPPAMAMLQDIHALLAEPARAAPVASVVSPVTQPVPTATLVAAQAGAGQAAALTGQPAEPLRQGRRREATSVEGRATAPVADAAALPAAPAVTAATPATLLSVREAGASAFAAAPVAGAMPAISADAAIGFHVDAAQQGQALDQVARDIAATGQNGTMLNFKFDSHRLGSIGVEMTQQDAGLHVRFESDDATARDIIADQQRQYVTDARAAGVRIAETTVEAPRREHGATAQDGGASRGDPSSSSSQTATGQSQNGPGGQAGGQRGGNQPQGGSPLPRSSRTGMARAAQPAATPRELYA
jgi:hypothetical protein